MTPDYHLHTSRCGHAGGEMRQYVEAALSRGLEEIGFSDHIPMYWLPEHRRDPGLAMAENEFAAYVADVLDVRGRYPFCKIRLGAEVDFVPGWERVARCFLADYPLDYVIGSVHYIDGWGFDNPGLIEGYGRHDIDDIYGKYFELLCGAAASGLFDIMAHPDLIKKFGHRPCTAPIGLYRKAARSFAAAGVCVEINTAGLRAPAGEIYPSLDFLRLCRLEGVPAVTGSDAHAPEQVGANIAEARELLKEAGYKEVAVFEARRRRMVEI